MIPGEIITKVQRLKLITIILKQLSKLKIQEIDQFKWAHIFIFMKLMQH